MRIVMTPTEEDVVRKWFITTRPILDISVEKREKLAEQFLKDFAPSNQ